MQSLRAQFLLESIFSCERALTLFHVVGRRENLIDFDVHLINIRDIRINTFLLCTMNLLFRKKFKSVSKKEMVTVPEMGSATETTKPEKNDHQ